MVMCFAPTCKHYSERDGCKFFVFPKNPIELRKWLKIIRRKDREPSKYSRICSCHFVNGDRSNGPSIFDYNVGKRFEIKKQEADKSKHLKMCSIMTEPTAGPSGLQQIQDVNAVAGPSGLQQIQDANVVAGTSGLQETQTLQSVMEVTGSEVEEIQPSEAGTHQFHVMVEAENYFLHQEVERLKEEIQQLKVAFSFKHIEGNNHLISVYTGLPTQEIFLSLYSLFENIEIKYFMSWQVVNVPKVDQLLITLMKLKLNLLNDDLGNRFKISRETVSNVFKTWLFALHEILFLQLMKDIPSRGKNKMCMPDSFSSFTNCRMIIDCTEVNTIHPKNMDKQRVTYSSYKHRNTLKGLIAVAPNGVVTFVSKLYPGSTSDKKITEHCGIIQKLVPGDLVLADKGFLISDLLPQGVSLNVPPFLCTPQFTREQAIRTRTIAKARIHVERAIKRIKQFAILQMIPATLIPHASVVFQVCSALTNLHFPLIKEVEKLYDY